VVKKDFSSAVAGSEKAQVPWVVHSWDQKVLASPELLGQTQFMVASRLLPSAASLKGLEEQSEGQVESLRVGHSPWSVNVDVHEGQVPDG
jgi:hypothetical protein